MKTPAECISMTELRQEIDRIDGEVIALLAARKDYIDRAIELKQVGGLPARIESRIEDVVARVRSAAEGRGFDPEFAELLWRQIIEWSIAREEAVIGRG